MRRGRIVFAAGAAVLLLSLTLPDGTAATVNAYHPFPITGVTGCRTVYEPCHALSAPGNRLMK